MLSINPQEEANFGSHGNSGGPRPGRVQRYAEPRPNASRQLIGAAVFTTVLVAQWSLAGGGLGSFILNVAATVVAFAVLLNAADNFSQIAGANVRKRKSASHSTSTAVERSLALSAAAFVVSFGAFSVVSMLGVYIVSNTVDSKMAEFQQQIESIPGTQYYSAKDTVKQSGEVRDVLRVRQDLPIPNADSNAATAAAPSSASTQNASAEAQDQIAGLLTDSAAARQTQQRETFQSVLALPAVLVVAGILTLLWGVFYLPAALLVAGSSEAFSATVNPLNGLKKIGQLRLVYWKILLNWLAVVLILTAVTGLSYGMFRAIDNPAVGALPAVAIAGFAGFYLWTVFSRTMLPAALANAARPSPTL